MENDLGNLFIIVWAATFLFVLNFSYIQSFFKRIFTPKMKIIKARIIRFKIKNSNITLPYLNSSDALTSEREYTTILEHLVFIEDENKEKYFISIPPDSYAKLKEQKSFLKENKVLFYFKRYFMVVEFEHLEIVA